MRANEMHGKSYSKEYRAWVNMIARCENESRELFHRYGGRGITVCARWRSIFEAFLEDIGPAPKASAQLDREDNDGNYEPSNCRWVTPKQNANNRSSNRVIAFDGLEMTLSEWADHVGIHKNTLIKRLSKWSLEKSLTTPLMANGEPK